MRKFGLCVAAVVLVGFSVAIADEFSGTITKVDGKTVSGNKKGEKKGEKGPEFKVTVNDKTKIVKGKFDKETKKLVAGDELSGGLTNEVFSKIPDKGVGCRITEKDGVATEIVIIAPKKVKKGT